MGIYILYKYGIYIYSSTDTSTHLKLKMVIVVINVCKLYIKILKNINYTHRLVVCDF